jgi:hypothetical protein
VYSHSLIFAFADASGVLVLGGFASLTASSKDRAKKVHIAAFERSVGAKRRQPYPLRYRAISKVGDFQYINCLPRCHIDTDGEGLSPFAFRAL